MRPVAATLAIALLGTAAAAPKVKDKPAADSYFPTRVGTAWVLWDGRLVDIKFITKVEDRDGGKVVSVGRVLGWKVVPAERLLVSEDGLFLLEIGGQAFNPPRCLFKPGAAVGDEWTAEFPDGITTYKRGARTDLVVPAGQYEGVPVTATVDFTRGMLAGRSSDTTEWYAPGVGVVRVEQDQTSWVLKAFCPGR